MIELEAGTLIDGKYKILKSLGKGGEGSVYLAVNESAYKFWAIKVMPRDSASRSGRELELWKHFSHPNLPDVVDVIENETELMVVMDYIKGKSLASILMDSRRVRVKQAVLWAIELCQVLTYLHNQVPPVIYGDLKPSNLIFRSDGRLILIDFGTIQLAKWGYREASDPEEIQSNVSRGTRGYAAPEQYGKRTSTDNRTDIYGLGATMFQLVTGRLPTIEPKRNKEKELLKHAHIPRQLQRIILKCLQYDQEKRYAACSDCERALRRFLRYKRAGRVATGAVCLLMMAVIMISIRKQEVQQIQINLDQIYEAYLEEAKYSVYADQKALCQKAIILNPIREQAYQKLLEVLLEDGNLSEEEDLFFRKILRDRPEGSSLSNEEELERHPKEYNRVSYRIAIAYWYYFEENGGKAYAAKWFQNAALAQSGELTYAQRTRAAIMSEISTYYDKLRSREEAGEEKMSYLNYWGALMKLYEIPEKDTDNVDTSLLLWKEITGQICNLTERFLMDGVEELEMRDILDEIEIKVKQLGQSQEIQSTTRRECQKAILLNVELGRESLSRTKKNLDKR